MPQRTTTDIICHNQLQIFFYFGDELSVEETLFRERTPNDGNLIIWINAYSFLYKGNYFTLNSL
jgi:hypothetical protein